MPPSQQPKSLQEILKQRQRSEFVGREDYLSAFSDNLQLPVDDSRRRFLFNVWGQGGVGKSTLLNQFSKSAQEAKAATAYTDESETSLPEALGRFAEQFERQGYKLGHFSDRYRLFRQKKQELETDPEAPQGFSAFVGKTVVKAGVRLGRRVPVGGVAFDFVDEDALSNQAGEWASYLAKKLSNKDDIQLIQEPIEVLTPLFLQGLCKLAEQAPIALFFDTYEQTDEFLDSWLRDVLDGKYGDVPPNIVITIAGRHALVDNHWATYDGVIARFPLEPFTEDEAKQYLHRKGITNPKVVDVILQLSGRLPLLIATLAAGSPDHPAQVGEPSDTAVERFLKWVEDPKQRQIALSAALPRKYNRDIIAQLAGADDAEALFNWLKKMPFVKQQRDSWVYHQVVRVQILRYQRLTSPKAWETAQGKLGTYFDQCRTALTLEDDQRERDPDWQRHTIEAMYHNLCGAPQQNFKPALKGFLEALSTLNVFFMQWVVAIEQAGQDAESQDLQDCGKQLVEGLVALRTEEYIKTVNMFSKILEHFPSDAYWQSVTLTWRASIYDDMHFGEGALRDLNSALEINPECAQAFAERGRIYQDMERYEEALSDLNRAIELNPNNMMALAQRGVTYRCLKRYEEALSDLTRGLAFEPNTEWIVSNLILIYIETKRFEDLVASLTHAIDLNFNLNLMLSLRGDLYQQMGRYEEALVDLNRAIELNPDNEEVIASRGVTYRQMERYEEALADLNRAIELNPDNEEVITHRGVTYRQMERYEEALADLTRALELKASHWTLYERGNFYRKLDQPSLAQADFQKAIQLVEHDLQTNPDDIQDRFNLALYYLANSQFELSKQTYQKGLTRGATPSQIREAVQDLKEFLKLFPAHPQAMTFYNGLRKKLESLLVKLDLKKH